MEKINAYMYGYPLEPTNVQFLMVFTVVCEYFVIGTDSTRRPGMPRGLIQGFLSEYPVAEKVMSFYLSNEKYPSCVGYIEDYTTRFDGDYHKP